MSVKQLWGGKLLLMSRELYLKAPCFCSPWVCSLFEGHFSSDSWRMRTYEDNLAYAKTFLRLTEDNLSGAIWARCQGRQFVWRSYDLKFRALSLSVPVHLSNKWIMQGTVFIGKCGWHADSSWTLTQQRTTDLRVFLCLVTQHPAMFELIDMFRDSGEALAWSVSN